MSLCDKALEHLKSIIIGIPLRLGIYQVLKMRVDIRTDTAAISCYEFSPLPNLLDCVGEMLSLHKRVHIISDCHSQSSVWYFSQDFKDKVLKTDLTSFFSPLPLLNQLCGHVESELHFYK